MLAAMSSCLVLGFLLSMVVGAVVVMVVSPWFGCCTFRVETRHVHAERHLAKAGVARRKGRGLPTLGEGAEGGTERAERSGGLHKRSAEDWGSPLCRAIGAEPLSEACLPYCARLRAGLTGRA